jgi:hypothetical protein
MPTPTPREQAQAALLALVVALVDEDLDVRLERLTADIVDRLIAAALEACAGRLASMQQHIDDLEGRIDHLDEKLSRTIDRVGDDLRQHKRHDH